MPFRSREADRREAVRFEIIGHRGATLVVTEVLRVVNLSRGGLQLETARPLGDQGVYTLQLESNAVISSVQARVLRVSRLAHDTYNVALEFLTNEPAAAASIDRMLEGAGAPLG
jgi:hypothetical protein